MFKIKTMNKIAPVGLERLGADSYAVGDGVELGGAHQNGVLVFHAVEIGRAHV